MDQDIIDALNIRADAALKIAMVSLEFQVGLARHLGLKLDIVGAADALISTEVLDNLDAETFAIEKASRERAALILRDMASQIA